eukprot:jgi/Psemu1/313924/fgenesh1_kg.1353_\
MCPPSFTQETVPSGVERAGTRKGSSESVVAMRPVSTRVVPKPYDSNSRQRYLADGRAFATALYKYCIPILCVLS